MLLGSDDTLGVLDAGLVALECALEAPIHHDDTTRTRHLEFEVGVVWDHHDLPITWPLEDGVV